MFARYSFNLKSALKEREIPVFSQQLLQKINIHKVQVEPVERTNVVVYYLEKYSKQKIQESINQFLLDWDGDNDSAPGSEERVNDFVVEVSSPRLEQLCTCHEPKNVENVTNELIENNWLSILKGKDVGYSKEVNQLLELFDKKFVELFSKKIREYEEKNYSPLISTEYLEQMGYFTTSANHIFFAAHLNTESNSQKEFYELTAENEGQLQPNTNVYLETPKFVLQTAPCFKVYFGLENTVLDKNKVFTIKGGCYRNEGKRTFLLERLNHFSMREFVFVGTPEFIMKNRDLSLELTVELMDFFGLKCHSELANDPFFLSEDISSKKEIVIPDKVKYEVRAEIPYKNDSISIASHDTHGNFFSEIFNIKFNDGSPVWSGCIGLGLERCVWSFLQQYGANSQNWPKEIIKELCLTERQTV